MLRPALLISVFASLALMLGPLRWPSLYLGRFLTGAASGTAVTCARPSSACS
ncbi:hypothetical protein [Amycolatopsis sp. NPDC051061]|uniref:hypothetical protein n=1 Tax=Amycolatopsis sp. NPDC051061 TaxID=3155042 RepID=UPI0034317E13